MVLPTAITTTTTAATTRTADWTRENATLGAAIMTLRFVLRIAFTSARNFTAECDVYNSLKSHKMSMKTE